MSSLTGVPSSSIPNLTGLQTINADQITTKNITADTATITSITGTLATTLQPLRNIVPSTNQLFIGDVATNQYIEIAPNTALIDFISSGASSTDYNARIRCTGGTVSTGSGTLTLYQTILNFNNSSGLNRWNMDNNGNVQHGDITNNIYLLRC